MGSDCRGMFSQPATRSVTTSSGASVPVPSSRPTGGRASGGGILGNIGRDLQMGVQSILGRRDQSGFTAAEFADFDRRSAATRSVMGRDVDDDNEAGEGGGMLEDRQASAGAVTATPGLGYSTPQIESFLSSRARGLAAAPTEVQGAARRMREQTPESFISQQAERGERLLSRYLTAEEVAGMSDRQKLAAMEAASGRSGNFLSAEDLVFIRAGAGGESDLVYSPMGSVQPVRGTAEAERIGARGRRTAEQMERIEEGERVGTEARAALERRRKELEAAAARPKPIAPTKGGTIFTSPQGIAGGTVGGRRSLVGGR